MAKGTVKVKFAKGFGNNLFRYCFCRLLAEYHDLNYAHPALPELGIKEANYDFNKKLKTVKFKAKSNLLAKKFDTDHHKYFTKEMGNRNYDFYKFVFYFEDYTLYKPHVDKIRTWFPVVEKKHKNDLAFHLRLENRAVQVTHDKNAISPEVYKKVIKDNFKFNQLYIVTDSEKWGHVNKRDIEKLHRRYARDGEKFIPIQKSINYINGFVDCFEEFEPIPVHHDKYVKDFNFIRSFEQVLFKNSTFSWWAALLSGAAKVGVFGPWKPNKGKRNKNLGRADFPGWFSWGDTKDLLNQT